ncbi:MAG: hypothetical protein WD356_10725 [Pseudomonadales bacterium]
MSLECMLIKADSIDEIAPKALLLVDPFVNNGGHPVFTGLTHLGAKPFEQAREIWLTGNHVESGTTGEVSWSANEKDLFVSTTISEQLPLEPATNLAYHRLFDFLDQFEDMTICRIWNFIRDINAMEDGIERYRSFNNGRLNAFNDRLRQTRYPSACGIGTQASSCIYLQATRNKVRFFENPRQISAYRYPGQYGPTSPSFSRASLVFDGTQGRIYVSGTASIVGHESLHEGDVEGQLDTTIANFNHLLRTIEGADEVTGQVVMSLLKVYVRHEEDLSVTRQTIARAFRGVPMQFLRGDICRKELLVEIEGVAEVSVEERS